ncbi:flavin reductase [Rhizobium sp. KVB221]|uniref:Flavin reductase n=1 Tax=Rhizobium setariae TaxID=2801340 RepID=A0A936YMW0_9HYPH|nr:flavin reductase [Rhizobium setariae]MBL0373348.1 flavin reductase [Rhizobium setariae]
MTDIAWQDAKECDRRVFRDMLGSFMTGVTVVATRDASGVSRAFTANSFTSVSLDPPLVLVCLAKSAFSYETFVDCDQFSISILGDWQREQSNSFASKTEAKEIAIAAMAVDGAPYVRDSLASIICKRGQVVDAGDHAILIGEVQKFHTGVGKPLGYFRGGYVSFGLAERQLERTASSLVVGGIVETEGRILLCRRPGATYWEIPNAPLGGGQQHSGLLKAVFSRFGIEAQSSFLYSIFQEKGDPHTTMVFSMEPSGGVTCGVTDDGTELRAFDEEESPWDLVRGDMASGMIQRLFRERAAGCLGIYCDTDDGGRVVRIAGKPTAWTEYQPELGT